MAIFGHYPIIMPSAKTQILNDAGIRKTLKRLAYQVYERNSDEKEIVIVGIAGRGAMIAEMIVKELTEICKIKIHLNEIIFNRENPSRQSTRLKKEINLNDKCVIVVDDVLNTGKTFMYAMLPFIETNPKRIQTLVLVDRNHKAFPISADYIGISLSTTLQEHVEVNIEKNKVNVFLK